MARYTVLAVNDSKDHCECCGRKGLKRVVWILDNETGEEKHFGTTCATQPTKGFGVDREIKAAVRQFEREQSTLSIVANGLYRKAGGTHEAVGPGHWRAKDLDLWKKCFNEAKERLTI